MTGHIGSIENRLRGCLWGLAVGNVLGLHVEGNTREQAMNKLGAKGPLMDLPIDERTEPWDDDLAMAMTLAEWLCRGGDDLDELFEMYRKWFHENGRGAGMLTSEVLDREDMEPGEAAREIWENMVQFTRPPRGNGSLMRVAPVGLACLNDPRCCRRLADLDASLTHWDPVCREASAVMALMVSAAVQGVPDPVSWARNGMGSSLSLEIEAALAPISLDELAKQRLDEKDIGNVLLCLQVAVAVLRAGLGLEEGILWAIRQGGDTDTNGAVVGALLGARDGLQAVPKEWAACVSQPEEIDGLGERLLALWQFNTSPPEGAQ